MARAAPDRGQPRIGHPGLSPRHRDARSRGHRVRGGRSVLALDVRDRQWPARRGRSDAGLPIAVQVIGRRYREMEVLAIAKELEDVFGGWIEPDLAHAATSGA